MGNAIDKKYLDAMVDRKVTVFLLNGCRLEGELDDFEYHDELYCIILRKKNGMNSQVIYSRTIGTISLASEHSHTYGGNRDE